MQVFRRRKSGGTDPVDETSGGTGDDGSPAAPATEGGTVANPPAASGLTGPFDITAAPADEISRLDLGGLQIPIVENMELHLEGSDEGQQNFAIAVIVVEDAALQLMAVAAPRSGGFWEEVMGELETEITGAGGTMERGEGVFGPELAGQVPAQDSEGNKGFQPARFVGAEGPRWFVRGMFMGAAATSAAKAEFFEDILAACVVNRGEQPMAPGDIITLRPPAEMEIDEEDADDEAEGEPYSDLDPFERGPEITEIR